ncbi:hypothetical protein HHK36_017586 [Tetracentron sinense]|uniref:Inhibitor of growth protein N-terminal histone-binding domain-containing protein n=1 Tax=Tetracentron sinense TaxID=13715 RepID=A0A834YX43_TETSI|nr:hypothetical protein HHK36_017586 [Tetracentron sinense]
MAIARTGVFVDDYSEYSSTLPAELRRLLNTTRELDERSQGMINQTREMTRYCLGLPSQWSKRGNYEDDEAAFEKMQKDIEENQENALSLCTEKVLLAQQAYELIDSHVKRLDEDLNNFAEDLKQEGKIPPDEPAILPPLPIILKDEKRKSFFGTPRPKRLDYRERDWDREQDRDFELMPPPGSHKKSIPAPVDADQPIDPNEPTYCVCHQVSFGDMIACDNENWKQLLEKVGLRSLLVRHVKEVNGSITHVLGSHRKQDSKGSGIAQPAEYFQSEYRFYDFDLCIPFGRGRINCIL